MKVNINIFFIFSIVYIFYLLGEFCVDVGYFVIPIYFFTGILYLLLFYFKYPKTTFHRLKALYKMNFGKFLYFLVLWTMITIVASIFQGTFILSSFISNYIGNFFNTYLFPFIIGFLTVSTFKLKSYKILNKILFFTLFSVLILGIIEYIGIKYNISSIKCIFSTLVNRAALLNSSEKIFNMAYNKPRIASIFGEPGELANFLVVSSPIYFYLYKTKEILIYNKIITNCLKLLLILLFSISLILTQSPINLVFILIIIALFALNNLKHLYLKYKKYFIYILSITIILTILIPMAFISNMDTNNNYLSRIVKVTQNIKSINNIILAEGSLGTRICTYEAQIRMGLDYPIFGVGYANMNSQWGKYVLKLPHTITPEVYRYAIANTQKGGAAFVWKIFAETGIIGVILLYSFLLMLLFKAKQFAQFTKNYNLCKAFYYSLLIYVCFSFYLALLPIFVINFGLLAGMVYNEKVVSLQKKYI